jgi:restriction system protein
MKGRNEMARRNKNGEALEGVVHLVALTPWWVGLVLAVASYFWLHAVAISPMPVVTGTGQMSAVMTGSIWRGLAMVGQYLLPLLCLAGAGMSAFKRRQAAQLHADAANRADDIAQMSWREFEVLVAEHFRRLGFSVTETGGGGPDGGIDLLLQRGSDQYIVQCKHWRARRVGVEPVRELYGVMAARRMAGGFVVTSGDFTEQARAFVAGRELVLINGRALQRGIHQQANSPVAAAKASVSRPPRPVVSDPLVMGAESSALECPKCGSAMVFRVAKKGRNAGHPFWGCSQFAQSKCNGTRIVHEAEQP